MEVSCAICNRKERNPSGWLSVRERRSFWSIEPWKQHPPYIRWKIVCGEECAQIALGQWIRTRNVED